MKRVVAATALLAVAVSGCGQTTGRRDEGTGSRAPTGAPATIVRADGVYKVGVDIAPGTYTTPNADCVAYTAATEHVAPGHSQSSGTPLARAIRVDTVRRIVVNRGEFFTTRGCGPWHRENPGDAKSADPATLAGGCEILLAGYELVRHVVWYLRAPTSTVARSDLQDMLEAPVMAHNGPLAGPARHLIRALDDPPRHLTAHGDVTPDITRTVAAIRHACAKP